MLFPLASSSCCRSGASGFCVPGENADPGLASSQYHDSDDGIAVQCVFGIQQTGAGAGGTDRPDQVAQLHFSTGRTVREDYFGLGANNPTFFHIAINVPGGAG
jgi:hypothetical protein